MNHWNLFKEAWRIFWRNQTLWVFGLLAALGGGFNLRYNFNFNYNVNTNFDPEPFLRGFDQNWQRLPDLPFEFRALLNQIFSDQTLGTIVVIGIVWTIMAFLLATYADGALISMVNTISGGQKVSVGEGFRAGGRRFLHLLAVRFVLALPTLTLAIVGVIVTSQIILGPNGDAGSGQFFSRTFGAIAGLGALSLIVGLVMMGIGVSAERAVVLDELPIWPAIVKGWKFLWGKFGDYFTLTVLFIGVAILAGIVFACLLTPILCGAMGLGSLGTFGNTDPNIFTRVMVFTGPTILIGVLLGLLFGALANVFASSVWTLAYREWNQVAQPAMSNQSPFEPPPGDQA
ncbi:hypothetical protein TFLX_04386 [Thermoflexales bacterium]|nr:hypothetical protein TFLX_04386 [Thermoflexales bacterium]